MTVSVYVYMQVMQGLAAWSEGKSAPPAPSPTKVPYKGYLAHKKQQPPRTLP